MAGRDACNGCARSAGRQAFRGFLGGLPQAYGNLGRSPVSRCVALRGETHRGLEYVAARLARPDMPDAAVVDMLRPYRRNEDIAALRARCPVARQGSADRIGHAFYSRS